MDPIIERKIERYMKLAGLNPENDPRIYSGSVDVSLPLRKDSLSEVIKTQKDADAFMEQLEALTLLANKKGGSHTKSR
ncbi:MAG: hypothetical protein V4543_02720 [Bacteroidota bacterium]